MAWAFSLSAECGAEQIVAEQFAQHFDGLAWVLTNGHQSQCQTTVFQDIEGNWWCQARPSGISDIGIDGSDPAYQMTELGILLYQRLQSAPPFRYALVGVEVDEFRTFSELCSEITVATFPGLVLAKPIWQSCNAGQTESLRASTLFRPFSAGYVWQPYAGEVYQPLMVSPDLKNKLNGLLALQ